MYVVLTHRVARGPARKPGPPPARTLPWLDCPWIASPDTSTPAPCLRPLALRSKKKVAVVVVKKKKPLPPIRINLAACKYEVCESGGRAADALEHGALNGGRWRLDV